jgi:hypothetical protein
MLSPKLAAATAVAGVLAANAAAASAQDPTPTPTPTPIPTPPPTPPGGTTVYVITVTTTTTNVNGPITWVAAPITTGVTNTSATNTTSTSGGAGGTGVTPVSTEEPTELNLKGCSRSLRARRARAVVQDAQIRIPRDARLLVRVNGRKVGSLELDGAGTGSVPLRVRLTADGRLTVRRPSRNLLSTQACVPSKRVRA